jgi:hypothetical protein
MPRVLDAPQKDGKHFSLTSRSSSLGFQTQGTPFNRVSWRSTLGERHGEFACRSIFSSDSGVLNEPRQAGCTMGSPRLRRTCSTRISSS